MVNHNFTHICALFNLIEMNIVCSKFIMVSNLSCINIH